MNIKNNNNKTTIEVSDDEYRMLENICAITQNECRDVGLEQMSNQAAEIRQRLVNNRTYDK